MRIKLLTAAVVSASVLLTCGVARANWVNITNSSDTQLFIDDSNVERRGDTVFYWEKQVFTVPQEASIKSLTSFQSANCASRVNRMHRLIAYNSAGIVIGDKKLSEQESPPRDFIPGTHGEEIYKAVCSNW